MKTDKQLKSDITEEFAWDPAVNSAAIGVEVNDGVVTLRGCCQSLAEKLAAEAASERVSGVKAVVVYLEVGAKPDSSDEVLAIAARGALASHVHVPADDLKVRVEKGWISLSGAVEWGFQRNAAERVVSALRDARGVSNSIVVKQQAVSGNIAKQIDAAMRRHVDRESHRISVHVEGGTVTLSGKVDSLAERRAAAGAAWSGPGVTHVVNNLEVI